jgi:putative sterol carrier protein
MPVFPSKEWCEEAIRLINSDPESVAAGEGWQGDFGIVIDPEPGKLAKSFVVHCVPQDGKVNRFKLLADPDDLDEYEPAYLARGPYSVWKGLIRGTVDPVEAVLRRWIAVTGEIQPLIERMRYKGIADRVLARLPTQFTDDK